MLEALKMAIRRGVKVQILTNSHKSIDLFPPVYLARTYYKELMDENFGADHAPKIYEYYGKKASDE